MTKSGSSDLDDRRLSKAALWFARLESGDLTETEQTRYQEWIGQTPENQEAIEQIRKTWSRTGIAGDYFLDGPGGNGGSGPDQAGGPGRVTGYLRQHYLWLAGTVALVSVAVGFYLAAARE